MKRTLTALTVAATMFASNASAFDPDDLQKLRDTGDCYRCDLSGADLRDVRLTNVILSYSDLSGADLSDADLSDAFLNDVDLSGADLSDADLSDAFLNNANLRGADLRGTSLRGTSLPRAIMDGAIFCNTTMPDGSVIYSGC